MGLWHSSSVCAVCPMGYNSDSSQAWFDVGEQWFGYVELPLPSAVRISWDLSPSLDPRGFEDYAADEPPLMTAKTPYFPALARPTLVMGSPFAVGGR